MFILLIYTCILTTQATPCDNGYYGPSCQLKCSTGCRNNTCHLITNDIGKCSNGCTHGFYGTQCNIPCEAYTNTCRKCPQDCEGGFCQLGLSCAQGCQDSYYGTACKSCPAGCEVCNTISGTCEVCHHCEGDCSKGCKEGCEVGYFGTFCEHSCSSHCASGCNQITGNCYSCKPGSSGATCKKHCPSTCVSDQCNMDGQGWYGQRCESKCGTKCAKGKCNRKGICTDGCRKGLYGKMCQDKCSLNCFKKRCDIEDGSCRSCKRGFYGSLCNKTCERCFGGSCIQQAGHCIRGCVSNYTGKFCQHECSGNCTADEYLDAWTTASRIDKPSEPVDSPRYLIAGGCLASIVSLVISGCVLDHIIRNRNKRRHRIHNDTTDGQQQPQNDITATHRDQQQHVYSQLDEFTASPPHALGARSSAIVWSTQTSSSTESPENVENDNETPPSFHLSIVNSQPCRLESTEVVESQPGPSMEHSYLTAIAPTGAEGLLSRREINSGRKVEDDDSGSNKPADHDTELDENESFHDEGRLVEDANPGTYVNFRGLYRREKLKYAQAAQNSNSLSRVLDQSLCSG